MASRMLRWASFRTKLRQQQANAPKRKIGRDPHVTIVDIGTRLREAREERGLELAAAAAELKVAPKDLRAIEWDRVDLLPPDDATRRTLARYAELLGVDPAPLMKDYEGRGEPDGPGGDPPATRPADAARSEPEVSPTSSWRGPSDIALAAASGSFDLAKLQLTGVRESLEHLANEPLSASAAVQLWAFVQCARDAAHKFDVESEKLAQLLLSRFLRGDGAWPLSEQQQSEYHEILAALSTREANAHLEKLGETEARSGGTQNT
jgi:transcriptional regulator with XRE-family HTH domain